MVVNSEALNTCERLAQGRYSATRWPGVSPVDYKSSAITTTLPRHIGNICPKVEILTQRHSPSVIIPTLTPF